MSKCAGQIGDPQPNQTEIPLVHELTPAPSVNDVIDRLADLPGLTVLESTLRRPKLGEFSFVTADPVETSQIGRCRFRTNPFVEAAKRMSVFLTPAVDDLPPFQGGVIGVLSYELGQAWERIPRANSDEFQFPDLTISLYDWVIAWNHRIDRAWVVSQGIPELDLSRRKDRASRRMDEILAQLDKPPDEPRSAAEKQSKPSRIPIEELVPQFPVKGHEGLTSDFSREAFLRGVEQVQEYIRAGDVFQTNLAQRLLSPLHDEPPLEVYRRLRECNPATFAGYFATEDWAVVSSSPERFVALRGREVETRPIKGTRQRQLGPEADLFTRDELRESSKDQAENVMIVDLLRNDLSRVCKPDSVRVPHLCSVETYETVQHLVSEIRGRLRDDVTIWDLWPAVFPGGSITGAPKIRAMEIIAELEPTVRGPYCGSMFYVGLDGNCDSNILIRTLLCRSGWIQCSVGGGITVQSDPAEEYNETMHKADGMLRAIRSQ